jgi:murein DD-endopeptidase MepM/ murein hydrolase activator NlpD
LKRVTIVILCLLLLGLFAPEEMDEPPPHPEFGIGGSLESPNYQGCEGPYSVDNSNVVYEWPLENVGFNQYFSWAHSGVDLYAKLRDPIYSVGYGFVSEAGWTFGGYGYAVVIDHGDGWETLYAHMVDVPPVKQGDYVFPGKVVGYAGSTGNSTGYHVHFEVRHNGCFLDPKTVIDGGY